MKTIHGVDIELIEKYGELNKPLQGSRKEYRLVRGYRLPETAISLIPEKLAEVLSERFGKKLRPTDGKTEGVAHYDQQFVEIGNGSTSFFAVKCDTEHQKCWVVHEFEFHVNPKKEAEWKVIGEEYAMRSEKQKPR